MHDYFEQKIKGTLNNPPDFPFDEKAWKNMEGRLKKQPGKKWGAMAYLVPLAFLLWLLPLAFSWLAYEKLDDSNNKIEHLETMLESNATLLLDTIVERHVTVVYDTIYRTAYADVKIENNNISNPQLPFYQTSFSFFNKINKPFFPEQKYDHLLPPLSVFGFFPPILSGQSKNTDNIEMGNNNAAQKVVDLGVATKVDQLKLQPLLYDSDPGLSIASLPYISIKKKKGLHYYIYKMQPTRFALGIDYGLVNVADFGAGNSAIGLDAAIGYGKNLNLIIGAEYLQWNFKKGFEEEDKGEIPEGFPAVTPNSSGDELHELYGDFKFLQVPVGLEYTFFSNRRLRPYFGLGVIAQRALSAQLVYEYKTPSDNEYKIRRNNVLPNNFELKSAWGSLGIQYEFGDYWSFRLEGNAQFDLEKGKYKYEGLQFYKIKGGMEYRF